MIFEVLAFCDVATRNHCLFLSKRHLHVLTTEGAFKWRLGRLHFECGIYTSYNLDGKEGETWKSTFLKYHQRRNLWVAPNLKELNTGTEDDRTKSNIQVCVRIKPKNCEFEQTHQNKVTLPLHQRLALIKISNHIETNKEALSVLVKSGEWFGSKWAESNKKRSVDGKSGYEMENENSFSINQKSHHLNHGIHTIDPSNATIIAVDVTRGIQEFQFDHVFDASSTQQQLYETSVKKLTGDLINGFNCTVFTFGQTGSGKTHTMFGPPENFDRIHVSDKGIVPRFCEELLQIIDFRRKHLNFDTNPTLAVSYIEVFGNKLFDLLKNGAICGHNRAASQRHVLDGVAEIAVESIQDIMLLLKKGEKQKRKAATAMNEQSTRAHTLFILTLKQNCKESDVSVSSKLFLVDLGGSEKTKKSRIEAGRSTHFESLKRDTMGGSMDLENLDNAQSFNEEKVDTSSIGFVQGNRMREAVQINLGLLALKSCVEALNSDDKYRHVPYGNSKLTMLLSSSLGGNSKTMIIVCASQELQHTVETIAALNFGKTCKGVSNETRTGTNIIQDLIREIDSKIIKCEAQIKLKERWLVREESRDDSNAGEGSLEADGFLGREVKKTTTLVGAENERKHLEELLQKRAKLTGTSLESNLKGDKYGGSIGFGNANVYGMGSKYQASHDYAENYRFSERVQTEDLPVVFQERGFKSWESGDALIADGAQKGEMNRKRSKLAYSGISS